MLEKPKKEVTCSLCGHVYLMSTKAIYNKKKAGTLLCKKCPEYRASRSEIAKKSNTERKTRSPKYQKYLPYTEDLTSGKTTFLEVSEKLGLDDSTVCRFFHNNFNIKSKFGNKSLQEEKVYSYLLNIFPDLERGVRYESERRFIADFWSKESGFIEYDGAGFYHQEKTGDSYTQKYNPIRLSAQAYFGKEPYICWALGRPLIGYCAVKSPSEYTVVKLDKINKANDMLENCHTLKSTAGKIVFGLFYQDELIGVAKFGVTTNPKDTADLELRRFFVLDGTPKNTESWFLDKCVKMLPKMTKLVTYIHAHEKGSYLLALGWEKMPISQKSYDSYLIGDKIYSKRTIWGWAKKVGLIDRLGTTAGKEALATALGGKKIVTPSKIKFIKEIR